MPRIGVISDTHGLLRPEAMAALQGCDAILHAGDIGSADIVTRLSTIAPTTAVRGNNDKGDWASALPETEWIEIDGVLIHLLHDIADLDVDPRAAGIRVIVSGHSHRPGIEERDSVLHLNPGSAGPRRFKLPVSLSILDIDQKHATARIVELDVDARRNPRPTDRDAP